MKRNYESIKHYVAGMFVESNQREKKFSTGELTGDFLPAELAPNDMLSFKEEWDRFVDLFKKRYTYKDRDVFLLYTDRNEEPIESFNDVGAFEITAKLLISVDDTDPIRCYEDSYAGEFCGGAIELGTVQNYENEQRLVTDWVGVEYAKQDLAHRELAVSTDDYYSWTSERTRFKERHSDADDLDSMKKEWNELCMYYGESFDGDDISFEGVIEELNETYNE